MMDEQYKTYCLDIAGQMVVLETAKMVAFVEILERVWQWIRKH